MTIPRADFFPSFRKLLLTRWTPKISHLEAKKSVLRTRRLKTASRSTMKNEQESDMNLIEIDITGSIIFKETTQKIVIKNPLIS